MKTNTVRTIVFIATLSAGAVYAQDRDGRYVVFFRDKSGTPYSISTPESFLSARSLARRDRQGIAVTEEDLPVNPDYVDSLRPLTTKVHYTLRWVNAVLIEAQANRLGAIRALPTVSRITYVAPPFESPDPVEQNTTPLPSPNPQGDMLINNVQLTMLGLKRMHAAGIQGQGVDIAIFDAGFLAVNRMPAFSALFSEKRITDTYDLIEGDSSVFEHYDHGTSVLSVMAAEVPNVFQGASPKANYQLYVTEDVRTEYRIEEYNWMKAAELADSAGTDIIQSSLGYNIFPDDASMDYTTSQLDGKTSVISQAATKALARGMLVVNSAGNSAENDSWPFILFPGDVEGVLTVGGVDAQYVRNTFSSLGPTADGRIKPDVVALGSGVFVFNRNGDLEPESGTSFASPSIASLAAGVLQTFPEATPRVLYEKIIKSGTRRNNPNNEIGYGVPNYVRIVDSTITSIEPISPPALSPNPVRGPHLEIRLNSFAPSQHPSRIDLIIYTLQGQQIMQVSQRVDGTTSTIKCNIPEIASGTYLVQLRNATKQAVFRMIKL